MCFSKKKKLLNLERSQQVIINNISVENMIEKFFKVDEMARMVLSEQQLSEFNNYNRILLDDELKVFANINPSKFNGNLENLKIDLKSEN